MKFGWLFSQRWQAIKFAMIVSVVAMFQLAVYDRVDHQLHSLNARGFVSNRLEAYSRFEKEFLQVYDLSQRYVRGVGGTILSDVHLALDVYWSRVDTVNFDHVDTFGDYSIDISTVVELKRDLTAFEAAVGKLKPGDPDSLIPISALWEKYRDRVSKFSDEVGVIRAKQLTDSVSDQWELSTNMRTFQTVFGIFGAALLLIMLAELLWASRIVDRLQASSRENEVLAETDPLTGLANRRAFDRELAARVRAKRRVAGLWIDIDRFKVVNNAFGHAAGDKILVEMANVASRLGRAEPSAFISRISGDAFFMLLEHNTRVAQGIAERLCVEARTPLYIDGKRYDVSVSIGVASLDLDAGDGADNLLQKTSLALLAAKKNSGSAAVFCDQLLAGDRVRAQVEADLAEAIDNGEIEIAAQPKTLLSNGQICGFEALVRWRHPTLGPVNPELLCSVADAIGLSSRLGLTVADRAFELAASLKRSGFGARMSINISPSFGSHPTLVQDINAVVARHGLTANDIELEVTEDALASDIGTIRDNMNTFKRQGAHIAIDDFGKGHSNISRLMTLAISDIKIDKSTADHVVEDPRARAIIKSIVDLADALSIEAIVEGVETQEQADVLAELGVKQIQGYLISPPLPPLSLMHWLKARSEMQAKGIGQDVRAVA